MATTCIGSPANRATDRWGIDERRRTLPAGRLSLVNGSLFRRLRTLVALLAGCVGLPALAQESAVLDQSAPATVSEELGAFERAFRPGRRLEPLFPGWAKRHADGPAFLRDMRFDSKIRLYSFDRRIADGGARSRAFALGGTPLELETGWWRERVALQLGWMGSWRLSGQPDEDGTGLLAPGQDDYDVLGLAALKIRAGKDGEFTLNRQGLDLPYVNRSDSRMTPNTFLGAVYSVRGEDRRFNWVVGWLEGMKRRTSESFISMSEVAGVAGTERGLAMAGFKFVGESWNVGVIAHHLPDVWNVYYGEARTEWNLPHEAELGLAFQATHQRSIGDHPLTGTPFGATSVALRFSTSWRGAVFSAGCSTTGKEEGIRSPHGVKPAFLGLMQVDFDRAGEDACLVGLSYDFEKIGARGLSAFANHAWSSGAVSPTTGEALADRRETDLTIDYEFPSDRWLAGLRLRARVSVLDQDAGAPLSEQYRFIVNYTVPLF